VLGAIGFTWDHNAHLYLRRAASLARLAADCGDAARTVVESAAQGIRPTYAADLPQGTDTEALRDRVKAFIDVYRQTPTDKQRQLLARSGYLVPHWPAPFGFGAGAVEQLVIEQETNEIEFPSLGTGAWVLPTLLQAGSPEQVQRWVPPTLAGELKWCQMFSEPGSGSDAAAVRTSGLRTSGGWLVSGQKVWTTGAQHSDWGLATIRTGPVVPERQGITVMALNMKAAGVTVRPIREITGDELFCEVFLDEVFVPDSDVVGRPGQGWKVARTTLANERLSIGETTNENMSAYELIALADRYGAAASDSATIAQLIVDEHALRLLNVRRVTESIHGMEPGPEGSITKLLTAELAQRVAGLAISLAGPGVLSDSEDRVTWHYFYSRCLTIAGGSSEISRNVIAERILGLPRDPLMR
jgi:3-oxochol-4-en-24-oyl-CoA dehydrogenase